MKKVILMIDTSGASGRQFLRGIGHYIHTRQDWELYIQPPHYLSTNKTDTSQWTLPKQTNGIIVRDSPQLQHILNLDIPKIIFESRREFFRGITTVRCEHNNISKMAVEHFVGLGFINFAYCGCAGLDWSNERCSAYEKILESYNISTLFHYSSLPSTGNFEQEKDNISKWLVTLPKPLCIFACNDDRGIYVLEACKSAGLNVPEEVAVLGVDNDELICNLSSPALSSIKLGFERAGYEAAGELERQMNGGKPTANIVVKTQCLIKRQSSDFIAVSDADIKKALIFIRENFQKPIQVKNVVNHTGLSRRMLERRFKNLLKMSINDEINRLRIENIKLKLMNSHITIGKIAESLEYTDSEHFSRFFKELTSHSPTEYRRLYGNITG